MPAKQNINDNKNDIILCPYQIFLLNKPHKLVDFVWRIASLTNHIIRFTEKKIDGFSSRIFKCIDYLEQICF